MKKTILFLSVIISLAMLAGCSSSDASKYGQSATAMARKLGAPDWYFKGNMKDEQGIYGIGVSDFSDPIIAEKSARLDGRARLSEMVSVAITVINDGNRSQTGNDEKAKKEFSEKVKAASSSVLVGSMQVDRFDVNGEVRVLVFQPYEDLMKKIKSNAMKQDNEELKNLMSQITLEQFKEALESGEAQGLLD